jgi:hypothetical protein
MDDVQPRFEDDGTVEARSAEIMHDVAACAATERADRFEQLVGLLGRSEASRRWLAAFSGSDASET